MNEDIPAHLLTLALDYEEAFRTGDADTFDRVFHPAGAFTLVGLNSERTVSALFAEVVPSWRSIADPTALVAGIRVLADSPEIAVVSLEFSTPTMRSKDLLTVAPFAGAWKVVSKVSCG